MYLNHIFVFTICIVLPNGLYSIDEVNVAKEEYRKTLIERWKPENHFHNTLEEDAYGNVFIKVFVRHLAKKNEVYFDPNITRIGVDIVAPTPVELKANLELIDYFGNLLEIPYYAVDVIDGITNENKTLRVNFGYTKMQDIFNKIVDRCVEQKYGTIS